MVSKEYRNALAQNQPHWIAKLALRGLLTVLNLAIVGLAAWQTSDASRHSSGGSYYDDDAFFAGAVWFFIPIGLSLIWAFVEVPILLATRKPAHPGFYVSFDLVLFLIYAVLGGLYIAIASYRLYDTVQDSAYNSSTYGYDYSYVSYPSGARQGYPDPRSAVSNNRPYTYHSYSSNLSPVRSPGSRDYPCPYFDSCANQASYYASLTVGARVLLAAAVLLLIGMLLHLTLFVWACVDCARYNQRRALEVEYSRARMMATHMVQDMQQRGVAYSPFAPTEVPAPPPAAAGAWGKQPVHEVAPVQQQQTSSPPPQLPPLGAQNQYDFYAADRGAAYVPPSQDQPASAAAPGPAPREAVAEASGQEDKGKGRQVQV